MRYPFLAPFVAAAIVFLSPLAYGQTTAEQRGARLVADAQRALSSGDAGEAIRLADAALAQSPASRSGAEVKIRALIATGNAAGARATYDQYARVVNAEDGGLLRPIAIDELQAIASTASDDLSLRITALERLAAGSDSRAAGELKGMSTNRAGTGVGVLADAALARLGDGTAASRLGSAAWSSQIRDKSIVAEAIQAAGARDQSSALVALLGDASPTARAAAADALGALGCEDAVPTLRARLSDEEPTVRVHAAIALKRLGDSAGDALVAIMLRSPAPDARLAALDVSPGVAPADRAAIISAAIADEDPLNRIKGAEALGKGDPAAARAVLLGLIDSPDLAVRREAGRVFDTLGPADLRVLRGLMASNDGWTRAYAAGGVVAATAVAK